MDKTKLSMTAYVQWLLEDQCRGLLNMTNQQIADAMQISRPTVDTYLAEPGKVTAKRVDLLENHVQFVKAALLTTEAGND